jgi:hypothetical protein
MVAREAATRRLAGRITPLAFEEEAVKKDRLLRSIAPFLGVLIAIALAVPAQGQTDADAKALEDYFKVVRGDIVKRRDSALRGILQLEEAEAKAFWPLKEQYDAELKKMSDVRLGLVREYAKVYDKLTAETANDLAARFLTLDEQRLALHRKYFKLMTEQVSPVIAVQFLQLQRQFETMADMKLATNAPLAVK